MAIKDRDGKVYTLRGPNPLMRKQQEWDRTKVHLFNMNFRNEVVVADERNPVEELKAKTIDIAQELNLTPKVEKRAKVIEPKKFIEEIRSVPKEKPTVVSMPEPTPVITVDPKMARVLKDRGVAYYCAPAVGRRTHSDDLYGTSYGVVEYGDKFIFDAIIIDQSDFELQFWCVKPVTAESVVYRKDRGERWWRIKDVQPKTGGYIVKAIFSESNPDFS